MNNPKLSIICVTYNSADVLPEFLNGLANRPADWEVIFVDNASGDETAELVQRWRKAARFIQNENNRGWSAGNNQGIAASEGELILLANPDLRFEIGELQKLVRFLDERPEFAAAAPQLLNPDGSIQPSCRRLPTIVDFFFQMTGLAFIFPGTAFNRWKMPGFDHQIFREVGQPMASALLVRGSVFEKVGSFDERFFVFFGDVDFCRRLKEAGLRSAFWPEAKVFHRRGASTRKMGARFYFSSHSGFFSYLWKWSGIFGKAALLLLWPLVILAAFGRAAFALLFRR
jgi:hypothetical protein